MPITPPDAGHEVTELLRAWGAGDAQASDSLVRLVYDELRRQARLAVRREHEGHTLQPTALVHEAWLRLGDQRDARWESRTQFFAVAAKMMRRDRKSTRLNSSHANISYAVFCLKQKP